MENLFTLFLFAGALGFTHAFEGDHLVAISALVTKRAKTTLALKDGIFWGLGHTSTILLIGLMIIVGKVAFPEGSFGYLEAMVGLMLVGLGLHRFYKLWQFEQSQAELHVIDHRHQHHLAYGVGLVHGLAGSGAMVLLVMTEIKEPASSILYLLIFGLGSVVGMLVASGIFSLPFSKALSLNMRIKAFLTLLSALACLGFGAWVLYENLVA
ncbi:MAG: hydantoin utilization protein A [Microscillaceae bacterium]